MLNRQSSWSESVLDASMSRSAIATSSAISARLVLCAFSQPNFCQFSKLTSTPNQESLGLLDHSREEIVALGELSPELLAGVQGRIHLAAQLFFGRANRRD